MMDGIGGHRTGHANEATLPARPLTRENTPKPSPIMIRFNI
jgi:hypothetical protein